MQILKLVSFIKTKMFKNKNLGMVNALNEISQIATDMPITETQDLGQLSLRLAERYKELVEEARIAQNLLTSPNLAQKIKVSVQKLGTVCIDIVKIAGQRRAHSNDEVKILINKEICILNKFLREFTNNFHKPLKLLWNVFAKSWQH